MKYEEKYFSLRKEFGKTNKRSRTKGNAAQRVRCKHRR